MTAIPFCNGFIHPLGPDLLARAIAGERDPVIRHLAIETRFLERALGGETRGGVLVVEGRVLCAAGATLCWHGRAEAWMFASATASRRALACATLACARELDDLRYDRRWRRVEMMVCAGAPWRESFARRLGMTEEGRAAAWDPAGRDYVLYARVIGRGAAQGRVERDGAAWARAMARA